MELVLFLILLIGTQFLLKQKTPQTPTALNNKHLNLPFSFSFSIKNILLDLFRGVFGLTRKNKSFGSAELITNKELQKVLNKKHQGLVMDGLHGKVKLEECINMAVIGGTGAGKTSSFIIPNLLQTNKNSSFIVTDPSLEIMSAVAHDLVLNGFKIVVLNLDGQQSACYNPLSRITTAKDIGKVARIIIDANSGSSSTDKFWTDGAKQVLASIITALKNYPDQKFCNMANLKYLLDSYSPKNNQALDNFMATYLKKKEDIAEYNGLVKNNDPKVIAGFISTCKTSLALWRENHIARLTSIDTLDLKEIRRTRTCLFIQFNESSTSYLAPILKILYTDIMNMLIETPIAPFNRHVHLLLDEFSNVGKIPDFSKYITTLRKRSVNVVIILQALEQIFALYGQQDGEAIMSGGLNTQLYLSGGLSIKTSEILSRTIGNTTIEQDSGKLHARHVLNPDEIKLLPKGTGLLLHHSNKPALIKIHRYYEVKKLANRTGLHFKYSQGTSLPVLHLIPLENIEKDQNYDPEEKKDFNRSSKNSPDNITFDL